MDYGIRAGDTSKTIYLRLRDSTTGLAKTGLAFGSAGAVCSYTLPLALRAAITLATQTVNGAWSSGGFVEVDGTNAKGLYRLDLPDAAIASGAFSIISIEFDDTIEESVEVELHTRKVNAIEISDGATAADNLELMFDGTGYIGAGAPSSREQVDAIGTASGGAVSINAAFDNTTTDTIDAGPAVDKGGGLVGIPVTGHAFTEGREVTIAGTTNYNGVEDIVSQTTNEIVITASFVSETFGGSETIISTIKTIPFVGTVTSGTFANTDLRDAITHDIADVGDDIDIVYGYNVGGGRQATSISIAVNVDANADEMVLKVYDHVNVAWDTVVVIPGSGGALVFAVERSLLLRHTGTGPELGNVYLRLDTDSTTPSDISVDLLTVQAVIIGQTVGYALGRIWVNTVSGTAGVEPFTNGVSDKPSLLWSDVLTLSADSAVNLTDFHIINGSTIQLTANSDRYSIFGNNWALQLNGQSIDSGHFEGADVSGVSTAATKCEFESCDIGTASMQLSHCQNCEFDGIVTWTLAGDYHITDSRSGVAGSGGPTFAKTAGQAITAEFRHWKGSVGFSGLEATDTMTIGGNELGTIDLGSPAGAVAVEVRGIYKEIINIGSAVVDLAGAIKGEDIASVLVDTDATLPAQIAALNNISQSQVLTQMNAAIDTAIPELGAGTPAATPNLRTAAMLMYMATRNLVIVNTSVSDELQIHNDAGTKIASKGLVDDGADYTESEMA